MGSPRRLLRAALAAALLLRDVPLRAGPVRLAAPRAGQVAALPPAASLLPSLPPGRDEASEHGLALGPVSELVPRGAEPGLAPAAQALLAPAPAFGLEERPFALEAWTSPGLAPALGGETAFPPPASASEVRPAVAALEEGGAELARAPGRAGAILGALFERSRGSLSAADDVRARDPEGWGNPGLESPSAHEQSPGPPVPPEPTTGSPSPSRRGAWAVYITHGVHLAALAIAWRIAWPLFVLETAGKAGLATTGSLDALADMIMSLGAGVIVGRLLPARSMAGAAVLRGLLGAGLAAAVLWWAPSLPLLIGISMAHTFALTTNFVGQASVSLQAVNGDGEALQRLNVNLKLLTAAVAIPGSLAGGWLVATMGTAASFLLYGAMTLLVLAPLHLWLLPSGAPAGGEKPAPEAGEKDGGIWSAVKLIFGDRTLRWVMAAAATAMVLIEPLKNTILPVLAKELLSGGPQLLSGLLAAYYVGQILGSLALLKWGGPAAQVRWVGLAAVGLLAFWLLPLVPLSWAFLYAAIALMTFFTMPAATVVKTLFQRRLGAIRPALTGQALGVYFFLYSIAVMAETAVLGFIFVHGVSYLGVTLALAVFFSALAALAGLVAWRLGAAKRAE